MAKKNLLILFGGQSSEHEVSCMSAMNIMKHIDRDRYNVIPVGITVDGHWTFTENPMDLETGAWTKSSISAVLSPDATRRALYLIDPLRTREVKIDVVFPVLHGLYGEDGTVQGLLELSGIPFVGSNHLASAIAMDKSMTKTVVDTLNIRQAKSVTIFRNDLSDMEACISKVEEKIPYPVFVKPCCAGSSRGVGKAENQPELIEALKNAAKHDGKILVEETIVGRELECAVFGTDKKVVASGVGEIVASAEFYDYDAKYHSEESKTITEPDLPAGVKEEIQEKAKKIFRAIGCFSLSRVDFFLDKDGVVFNEINTIPGFTGISMYPMLFEAMGVSKEQLVQDLLDTALLRRDH